MARKPADVEEKAAPKKVAKKPTAKVTPKVAPPEPADKYKAISSIKHGGSVYRPGDVLELTRVEAKLLRKQNAIELIED